MAKPEKDGLLNEILLQRAILLCFWVSLLTTVANHEHFVNPDMHIGTKYGFVGNLCDNV